MHTKLTPPPTARDHGIRRALLAMAATALGLGCVVWQAQAAFADTITVTTTIDDIEGIDPDCSLREAVQAANTDSAVSGCAPGNGADKIVVPSGTFTLTISGADEDANLTGDIDITDTLVISGAGASQTIIDANGIDRAMHSVEGGYTVTLAGLTIQHGAASGGGGGAWFQSGAVITDTAFVSNTSIYGAGGAEFFYASTVAGSAFVDNVSSQGNAGGAAFLEKATLERTDFISNVTRYGAGGSLFAGADTALTDVHFIGNGSQDYVLNDCPTVRSAVCFTGSTVKNIGGDFTIFSAGGALFLMDAAITRTSFAGNASPVTGGAGFYGKAVVTDSSFQNNSSIGEIFLGGELAGVGGAYFLDSSTVTGSDFSGNRAIVVVGGATFILTTTLANTTFHSNTATWAIGGALFGSGASLTATHFTSNTAQYGVGGAYFGVYQYEIFGTLTLVDSTFVGNVTIDEGPLSMPVAAKSMLATARNKQTAGSDVEESWGGGAVFFLPTYLTRTVFADNVSAGVGGALFLTETVIVDSEFIGNVNSVPGASMNQFDTRGGGAMFQEAVIISGSLFRQNATVRDGGGAFFAKTAELSDSDFISNTASGGQGGGIYVTRAAAIQNVRFVGNQGRWLGGGAHFGDTALITHSVFADNTSLTEAGGAFFRDAVRITGSSFEGNVAGGSGGGAIFQYTSTLRSTHFVSNTAASNGGALFASGADLAGSNFVSNTATYFGAGGASFESSASITIGRFVANSTARSGGGAIFSSNANITNTIFLGNHAAFDGGGVVIDSGNLWWWASGYARGDVHFVNSLFGGNAADNNGAAIYVHDTGGLHLLHVTIGSPHMQPNQAVAVHADTVYLTNTLIASHTIGIQRSAGAVHEDYTLFSGVETPREGTMAVGAHSRTGNAAFVDPAAGNYHLTARSDAINGGANTEVEHDFDGQLRKQGHGRGSDIGFDEFLQWIQLLTMVWKN